eukprot:scaffold102700_cov51-Phaeocystis_antarctica.AAC.1
MYGTLAVTRFALTAPGARPRAATTKPPPSGLESPTELIALQRPQPYVRVSGHQSALSLFLTHLPAESRARTARQVSATRAWVVNQVQNGRSASMRSMLPENRRHGQGQWPRRSARVNWELALAWAR